MMTRHATIRYLQRTCRYSLTEAEAIADSMREAAEADLMRSHGVRAAVATTLGRSHQVTVKVPRVGRVVVRNGNIVTVMYVQDDGSNWGRLGSVNRAIRGRAGA